jgi:hypothetical protein
MVMTKIKAVSFASIALTVLALTAGCTYPGDTSGFKAENKPSKDEINKQIADVKANPKLPDSVKAMALKKLEKDLTDAK